LPIELARLERLRVNAMRAPGVEDDSHPEPDYAERLGQLQPKAPETLGLMHSVHNLPDYYQVLRSAEGDIEDIADLSPCHIAVSRSSYRLSIHTVNSWQYALLNEVRGQTPEMSGKVNLAQLTKKIAQNITQEYLYAHLPLWLPVAVARGYLYF
jgi:hypothetical protein